MGSYGIWSVPTNPCSIHLSIYIHIVPFQMAFVGEENLGEALSREYFRYRSRTKII